MGFISYFSWGINWIYLFGGDMGSNGQGQRSHSLYAVGSF